MTYYTIQKMWHIYGKQYDLTTFANRHPGGAEIIEKTKGIEDCTPLFESYHAFSDIAAIKQSLDKYEIKADDDTVVVDPYANDFTTYHKLIEKIKEIFPDRAAIKAQPYWYVYSIFVGYLYVSLIYRLAFCQYSTFVKCILALFASSMEVSLLFNVLHDASHYAVTENPVINNIVSTATQGWTVWNHSLWTMHHIILHHSFTGSAKDPDTTLYDYTKMMNISKFNPQIQKYINHFIFTIAPGQHTLQSFLYTRRAYLEYPNNIYYTTYDASIILFKFMFLYSIGFLPALIYLTNINLLYYVNVFPNHDLVETHENNYDGPDWAKRQICNSGNFLNDEKWWGMIFGGINYQIEHHLFPNMSNQNYPVIAPIVKKFCQENDIPYVHEETLEGAYHSFTKRVLSKKEKEA